MENQNFSVKSIKRAVAEHYCITTQDLTGPSKRRLHAMSRKVAYLLCRRYTPLSWPEIGRMFGGRDHTTVIDGVTRAIEAERDTEAGAHIAAIETALFGPEFRTSRAYAVFRSTRGK